MILMSMVYTHLREHYIMTSIDIKIFRTRDLDVAVALQEVAWRALRRSWRVLFVSGQWRRPQHRGRSEGLRKRRLPHGPSWNSLRFRCKTLQIIHDIAWYVLNFLPIYMPASLLVFVDLFWISFLPLFVGVKFWHDSHGFGKERITHRTRLTKRTESAIHSGDSHINCVNCKSFEDQPILSPECAAFATHCGTSSMLQALSTASWSAPPVEHVCRYKAGTSGRATGEEHKEHPNQWWPGLVSWVSLLNV